MRHARPGAPRARLFGCGIGNDRDRAGADRSVNKLIAIAGFAPHGDKQVTRFHLARIVREACNVGVSALEEDLSSLQDLLKGHCCDFSAYGRIRMLPC